MISDETAGGRRGRRRWLLPVLILGAAPAAWFGLNGLGYVLEDPSRYPGLESFEAVEGGRLYRSGQLTGEDFAAAIEKHGIRTVLCVRGGYRNPLQNAWYRRETDYCREHGVNFVHAPMTSRENDPDNEAAIRRFWELVDDPANHPILVHCEAGVDRTGVLSYLYRVHRQGWSEEEARREMMDRGASRHRVDPILKQVPRMERAPVGIAGDP